MKIEWHMPRPLFADERPILCAVAEDAHWRFYVGESDINAGGSMFQFVMDTAVAADAAFRKFPPVAW